MDVESWNGAASVTIKRKSSKSQLLYRVALKARAQRSEVWTGLCDDFSGHFSYAQRGLLFEHLVLRTNERKNRDFEMLHSSKTTGNVYSKPT